MSLLMYCIIRQLQIISSEKNGMLIRIYGAHVNEYEAVLDTLPLEMQEAISHAPVCKRLLDPHAVIQNVLWDTLFL